MKVKLFMAMSLNGKISTKEYSEDFLSEDNWAEFLKLIGKIKYLVWGRNTYSLVKKWPKKYMDSLKDIKIIVVSKQEFNDKRVIRASSPKDAIRIANKMRAKEILLSGGSSLNKSFIKEKLIDEIIIDIEPVIIGRGIDLMQEDYYSAKLQLKSIRKMKKLVQLHYVVKKR